MIVHTVAFYLLLVHCSKYNASFSETKGQPQLFSVPKMAYFVAAVVIGCKSFTFFRGNKALPWKTECCN